ncbi:hypothetical protein JHK82_025080 [Glycine max]|nr:hypothetical protein JHK87_025023 [Glycine soja]KAG5133892.1 hypothetical protein JHK82_025080 [Glycine max]
MFPMRLWVVVVFIMLVSTVAAKPHRILLDTNVELDDVFAFLYRLNHNTLEFQLEGVTINANAWTNVGHAMNQVYDLLYMMGRDDIVVGMGSEG